MTGVRAVGVGVDLGVGVDAVGAGVGVGVATGAVGCATGGVTGAIVGSGSGWLGRVPGSEKFLISSGPTVFVSCAWKARAGAAETSARSIGRERGLIIGGRGANFIEGPPQSSLGRSG